MMSYQERAAERQKKYNTLKNYKEWKAKVENMDYGNANKEIGRLYESVERLVERAQLNLRKAEMMREIHPERDVYKFFRNGRWHTRTVEKPVIDDDGFVMPDTYDEKVKNYA